MWITEKKYKEMQESAAAMLESLQELKKQSILVGIERNGRVNEFTFVRNGKMIKIETMGLISDDLPGWKEKLLR